MLQVQSLDDVKVVQPATRKPAALAITRMDEILSARVGAEDAELYRARQQRVSIDHLEIVQSAVLCDNAV